MRFITDSNDLSLFLGQPVKKNLKINDLLTYSSSLFQDQGYRLENINLQKELNEFLKDRFKYYLKEKEIRYDITEAIISSFSLNKIFSSYEKLSPKIYIFIIPTT